MFVSFVFKIKSLEEGVLHKTRESVHEFIDKIIKEDDDEIQGSKSNVYTVSGIMGKEDNDTIEEMKNCYIRITVLEEKVFQVISSKIFLKCTLKEHICIGGLKFEANAILCDESQSIWAFSFNDEIMDAPIEKQEIKIITPAYIENTKNPFDIIYNEGEIFRNAINAINRYSKYYLDEEVIEEVNKVGIEIKSLKMKRVQAYGKNFNGIYGSIEINLSSIHEKFRNTLMLIIEAMKYIGIGNGSKIGYGHIVVSNVN